MDQTLSLKIKEFGEALKRLKESLDQAKNEFIRDSIIKRFEFAFELGWKTAKTYLRQKQGVNIFSPKECWRELRKNDLLSVEETEIFLAMTDERNSIVHTYDQNFFEVLSEKIKVDYYFRLDNLFKILEKNAGEN